MGSLATTAALSTVSWTCCTVVDNTNCPGKTNSNNKVWDGTVWAWNVKQKAVGGASGVLGTSFESGGNIDL